MFIRSVTNPIKTCIPFHFTFVFVLVAHFLGTPYMNWDYKVLVTAIWQIKKLVLWVPDIWIHESLYWSKVKAY